MSMAAILGMWPGPIKQTLVPPCHIGSIRKLTDVPSGFIEDV